MALLRKFMLGVEGRKAENQDLQDIVENLNNVLNTKKDYGSVLKDFGIRDMNEYSSREHIAIAVIREVKENIERYEPRVQLVRIIRMEDENPLRLSFRIECRLRETSQSLHMVFDSIYNSIHLAQYRSSSSQ